MNTMVVMAAAAVLGVDFGYQQLPDGRLEYIIQIEPDLVASLQAGEEITSEIPAELRGVRRFKIRVGNDLLPRHGRPSNAERNAAEQGAAEQGAAELRAAQKPLASGDRLRRRESEAEPPALRHAAATEFAVRHAVHTAPTRAAAAEEPQRFQPPANQTLVDKSTDVATNAGSAGGERRSATVGEPSKPWMWLTVALVGLFVSLGANVFQGWITLSIRRRYHQLVETL